MRVVFRTYTKKDGSPEDGVAAILQHLADHNEKNVVVRLDIDKKNVYGYDEEDFFFPSLKITKLEIKPIDDRKFEATFNTKDLRAMFVLLLKLGAIGNCGHSYELLIGDKSFYFDGDGADYVESINGVKLSSKIYDDKYKWPKIYNEDMEKNTIKLNEAQLRKVVAESVKKVLNEHMSNHGYHDMEDLMNAITSLINPINDIRYYVRDENVQKAIKDFEPHFHAFAQAMRNYCDENGLVMNS